VACLRRAKRVRHVGEPVTVVVADSRFGPGRARYVGIGIASFAEGTGPHLQGLAGVLGAYDGARSAWSPMAT
jgi:hypothetical protein